MRKDVGAFLFVLAGVLVTAVIVGAWWDDPFWRGISVVTGLTSIIVGDHL